MEWLQRAPERIKRARMGKFKLTFQDEERWPIDYGKASASLVRHGSPNPSLHPDPNPNPPTPTLALALALPLPRCAMVSRWEST